MPEEQPPRRALITPPPGLLPDAPPSREELEGTDSGTRRVPKDSPVFFARPPGAAPAPTPPAERADRADASAAAWSLRTAEGVEHPIPVGGLVVGRNPSRPEGWEDAAVLGILDPEKTVSKTHAALRIEGDELVVADLSSTNGTTVARPDGTDVRVAAGESAPVPAGSTVGFGSVPMRAVRT